MENKKGNGIFLGIVSVATLIVAIIGATFAYFSASTESAEDAVNLTAYEYKLSLSVIPIYPNGASSLIPLDADMTFGTAMPDLQDESMKNVKFLEYAIRKEQGCIDDNGLQVCALYQVKIDNQAPNEVILTGTLRTVSNMPGSGDTATGFQNLKYQALTGNHEDNSLAFKDAAKPLDLDIEGLTSIDSIKVTAAELDDDGKVTKPGVGYSYVLVYLDEIDGDQSSEMGSSYTGQLIYTSGEGGSKLTGTFNLTGTEPEEEPEEEPGA